MIPRTYNISVGSIAGTTITAPTQVENKTATLKAQEEAAQRQLPLYKILDLKNDAMVDAVFEKLNQLNADNEVAYSDKVNIYRTVLPAMVQDYEDRYIRGLSDRGQYPEQLIDEVRKKADRSAVQNTRGSVL